MQPRARRTALETADGALKAAVTAPPEGGKANAAVIALLAEQWHLPGSSFAVIRGASARVKTFSVTGEPALLADRIIEWVRRHG